jgi:hypothetical protein
MITEMIASICPDAARRRARVVFHGPGGDNALQCPTCPQHRAHDKPKVSNSSQDRSPVNASVAVVSFGVKSAAVGSSGTSGQRLGRLRHKTCSTEAEGNLYPDPDPKKRVLFRPSASAPNVRPMRVLLFGMESNACTFVCGESSLRCD